MQCVFISYNGEDHLRKRAIRLALAALGLALASPSVASAAGCPSNIVVGGAMACHLVNGTDCRDCTYHCDDGNNYEWGVCNPT